MKIFYYKGCSKHDPGYYWYINEREKFSNGPFFSHGDASDDALGNGHDEPLEPSIAEDGTLLYSSIATEPTKMLVRVEAIARNRMLAMSVALLIVMSWYGVYQLVSWSITHVS